MKKQTMIKKAIALMSAICIICVSTVPAYANEGVSLEDTDTTISGSCETDEVYDISIPSISYQTAFPEECYGNPAKMVEYLQKSPKSFYHGTCTLNVADLISDIEMPASRASGEVSDTFWSERMDTGTPGVTWDYKVDYTIAPLPGGDGWYFKDVNCHVYCYKEWTLYTWATSAIIKFTKAKHDLNPKSYPTSVTISITLDYQVWTQATGVEPITYSEDHSHTTTIENSAFD